MKTYALSLLVVASLSVSLHAADWPCWRGPAGNGSSPGPAALVSDPSGVTQRWESEEKGIPCHAWETSSQGGFDSPIVAGGMVIRPVVE